MYMNTSDFEKLCEKSKEELTQFGMGLWILDHVKDNNELWLFPHSWYNIIPEDFKCVDIFGNEFLFQNGVSDDDHRGGYLAYGIKRNINSLEKSSRYIPWIKEFEEIVQENQKAGLYETECLIDRYVNISPDDFSCKPICISCPCKKCSPQC